MLKSALKKSGSVGTGLQSPTLKANGASFNNLPSKLESLKKFDKSIDRRGSLPRISSIEEKSKKALEGEESTREPKTFGILKWDFSKRHDTEVYSVKFSPDDAYIAVGGGDARIYMYSTKTKNLEFTLQTDMEFPVPCTSLAFRPGDQYKTKNVLAASYADGSIRHWHYSSGQLLSTLTEDNNQTNIITYRSDGSEFATGGSDCFVRVYNGETHKLIAKMDSGNHDSTAGHSNRIFCVKFHPTDRNMMISGGWDNTLQIWDLRSKHSVRSIHNPHICGDAIDFDESGSRILTGSYSKESPLQLWKWSTGESIVEVPWGVLPSGEPAICLLYSAAFSKSKESKYIIAGGGGASKEVRVFNSQTLRNLGAVLELNCAVYSTAMSLSEKKIALGGGGRTLMVFDIDETLLNPA